MATKKELEERIAALETQVAMLLARPTYPVIGPAVMPQPSLPGWSPQVWCGISDISLANVQREEISRANAVRI